MHGYIAEPTLAERDEIQLFVLRELRHAIGLFQPLRFSCKDLKPDLQIISDYRFAYFVHRNEPFKTTEQKPTHRHTKNTLISSSKNCLYIFSPLPGEMIQFD